MTSDHFVGVNKMADIGSQARRESRIVLIKTNKTKIYIPSSLYTRIAGQTSAFITPHTPFQNPVAACMYSI